MSGQIQRIIAVARYDYQRHNKDELSFKKGVQFIILEKHSSGGFLLMIKCSKTTLLNFLINQISILINRMVRCGAKR